jgi:type I restriction enzyme, S subunit
VKVVWNRYKVGELTKFHKQGFYTKEKYDSKGNVYLLRGTDMQNPRITISDTPKIHVSEKEYEDFKVIDGDVLIVRSGAIGRYGIVGKDTPKSIFGSYLINFRFDSNKIRNDYFGYFYESHSSIKQLHQISQGASNININAENIKELEMLLPPLNEQKKIANILSTWDRAIELNKLVLKMYELQKKKIMYLLFSYKLGSIDYNSWSSSKLGELSSMQSGGTPKSSINEYYNGNILWCSISDITKKYKYITHTEKKISQLGLVNSSARIYPINTVLYAMYASIGECIIAKTELASSQAIIGIQCKERLYYEYLFYFLQFEKEKLKLQGQVGTQSNLNKKIVQNIEIPLPDFNEQVSLAGILSKNDNCLELVKSKIESLKLQKKGLMQQLLTGKIRVKP